MSELNNSNGHSWYHAYNPLLDGIPVFKEIEDVMDAIAFNPLEGIDIKSLSFVDRIGLLAGEKTPLEPTMQSARTAMLWYGMLTSGLRARNPTLATNKKHYYEILKCAQDGENKLPVAPTYGISINVVKGPTGTGKSVTQQRFCACLPQIIDHGKVDAAGWNSMRQLVYLNVQVSHDGSRGGFLLGILHEMDKALGTHYFIDLPKHYKTVEKLAVATIGRLAAHFTGILFVDEAQLRNLVESGQADLMQMFLLLLMNSGIPLVLSGNERAFDWVKYSQDKTRLALTPQSIFSPIGATNEQNAEIEWSAVADGVMAYYLLKNPIRDREICIQILWVCSGGIARVALTLWCNAQIEALYRNEESIGPSDIQLAYESPTFSDTRPLADGFHFKKSELLALYPDVDSDFYANLWRPLQKDSTQTRIETNAPLKAMGHAKTKQKDPLSGQAKFHLEQTRQRNKNNKRELMMQSMSPEDIRRQGLANYNLTKLEEMKDRIEKDAM